jgi:hypothetical protein
LRTGSSAFAAAPEPAGGQPDAPDADVPPGEITISVLNGSGVDGVARTAAEAFAARGYGIGELGDGLPTDVVTVEYDPAHERGVKALRAALPGAVFDAVPEHGTIPTVTVPADFDGPVAVALAADGSEQGARSAADDVCS